MSRSFKFYETIRTFFEILTVQKYECGTGCLAGSIMKLRGCDKQVWRNGKNLVGKEVP
jgi:hypothetical protein